MLEFLGILVDLAPVKLENLDEEDLDEPVPTAPTSRSDTRA